MVFTINCPYCWGHVADVELPDDLLEFQCPRCEKTMQISPGAPPGSKPKRGVIK